MEKEKVLIEDLGPDSDADAEIELEMINARLGNSPAESFVQCDESEDETEVFFKVQKTVAELSEKANAIAEKNAQENLEVDTDTSPDYIPPEESEDDDDEDDFTSTPPDIKAKQEAATIAAGKAPSVVSVMILPS